MDITQSETLFDHFIKSPDGNNRHVIIVTDCEPDDMIAIAYLVPELYKRKIQFQIVVSCWSDIVTKAKFMHQFLAQSFNDIGVEIFMGMPTCKTYNITPIVQSSEMTFRKWPEANWSKCFLIQLAPIQELMVMHQNKSVNFKEITMAIYGSFNIRSILANKSSIIIDVIDCLKQFQQVLFYETYFATDPIQFSTGEIDIISSIASVYPLIGQLIDLWNDCIKTELQYSTNKRALAIIDSISKCSKQFVNADTGLIATMLLPLNEIRKHLFAVNAISFDKITFYTLPGTIKPLSFEMNEQMIMVHYDGNADMKSELFKKHCEFYSQYNN